MQSDKSQDQNPLEMPLRCVGGVAFLASHWLGLPRNLALGISCISLAFPIRSTSGERGDAATLGLGWVH